MDINIFLISFVNIIYYIKRVHGGIHYDFFHLFHNIDTPQMLKCTVHKNVKVCNLYFSEKKFYLTNNVLIISALYVR